MSDLSYGSSASDSDSDAPRKPVPMDVISEAIAAVEAATGNYGPDRLIQIRVQDTIFHVAQSRLLLRCPAFRTMLSLSEGHTESPDVVELHNDVDEFKAFLWYIHADHLAVERLMAGAASEKKCHVLLGISSVAHMYEALDVANWAIDAALVRPYGPLSFFLSLDVAVHLLRTVLRFQGPQDVSRTQTAYDFVCDALYPTRSGALSKDPILMVLATKQPEINCTYVLAHAYFYTFDKGTEYWRTDRRLDATDRRRLLSGAYGMSQRGYYDPKVQKQLQTAINSWPAVHPAIKPIRAELSNIFNSTQWRIGD